jgi:uncharacterized membrane protein (DUF106 family)
MTDYQLYFAVGLPILAVLTSLIISLVQISNIRGDVESLRADFRQLRGEFADLRKEMNDARREAREDRLVIAADIKLLTGMILELKGQKP